MRANDGCRRASLLARAILLDTCRGVPDCRCMPAAAPADSATVIVLRGTGSGFEVLFVERRPESRAFAGAHVFPGGIVDDADADARFQGASPCLGAVEAAARLGESPARALAFFVAAIRELFEETGVLLARTGGALTLTDAATAARLRARREELLAGTTTFVDVVADERLELATDSLRYFSRWITPVNAPRRYDAGFFVALLPEGQEAVHDARETCATAWLPPTAALADAAAGRIVLAPPTVRTLDELAALASPARILAAADSRRVTAILPKPVQVDGRMAILYPEDADYDRAAPGAALVDDGRGRRDRVVMDAGAWRTVRSPG